MTPSSRAPDGTARYCLLTVVNYGLPATDYRLQFGLRNRSVRTVFGLPEPPPGVAPDDYLWLNFQEGFRREEIRELVRLFRFLRTHRAELDAVHLFSTKLTLLGPLLARIAQVPCIITITGFGRMFNDRHWWSPPLRAAVLMLMSLSIKCSTSVLFQNHGDMAWALRRLPSARAKARYIGSAVSFDVDGERRFDLKPLVVLLVSRLLPSKGIGDFLDVAERLAGDDFRFVLVGPSSHDYPELERRVREADASGLVTYVGRQTGDDLRTIYEQAHIFLFPSHGEGMARVMLEAGFAGLCPVAYDINANRDAIPPGSGHLVPLRDVGGLVGALQELSRDPVAMASMAQRYRAHVESEFSIDAYEARFEAILRECLPAGRVAVAPAGLPRS